MQYMIVGKNIEVTEGLRSAVYDKIGKLERYFTPETEVHVTLSVEKDRQKIEITIPMKGNIIRAEQVSSDMYVSIDLVEEIIERQLRKYKNKIVDKQQSAIGLSKTFVEEEIEEEPEVVETEAAPVETAPSPATGNAPVALAVIPVALAAAAIVAKKRG